MTKKPTTPPLFQNRPHFELLLAVQAQIRDREKELINIRVWMTQSQRPVFEERLEALNVLSMLEIELEKWKTLEKNILNRKFFKSRSARVPVDSRGQVPSDLPPA
ncbi:hypothetical protein [Caballeronia sp. AZ1_KS37]|uniref:hypothetical protein n=1 Tax=Caballeronia sp. AZ1_KS37 TaxID=2921756 RepID=UPI0020281CFF|nr:hypothetical protein [Caballeronia sp. AZ1_KS37]